MWLVVISLIVLSAASVEAATLVEAVEKLILEVHHLKLKVANLEKEVKELKEKRTQKVTVLRGKLRKSHTSCIVASTKKVAKGGKENLLSSLPRDIPVYMRKWEDFYVFLNLPEYCEVVKRKVKDARIVHIPIE